MNMVSAVKSLRRYARALTLSQRVGDRIVQRTLRAAMERMPGGDVHAGLFRIFHQVWQGEQATFLDADGSVLVDRRLSRLGHSERAVLLLTCMEEFPLTVTAMILGRPLAEVEADRARAIQQATWWPEIEPALHLRHQPQAAA